MAKDIWRFTLPQVKAGLPKGSTNPGKGGQPPYSCGQSRGADSRHCPVGCSWRVLRMRMLAGPQAPAASAQADQSAAPGAAKAGHLAPLCAPEGRAGESAVPGGWEGGDGGWPGASPNAGALGGHDAGKIFLRQ